MKRYARAAMKVATVSAVALAMSSAMAGQYGASKAAKKDIVETAKSAGNFTMFSKAVEKSGLADTFDDAGPFTVFAPTDEAFAKIPKEQLDKLLSDKVALQNVLKNHVVKGKVLAKDVKAGDTRSLRGTLLNVSTDSGVKINDAKVVKTDVVASNGVIHAIDTVILPK